MERALKYVRVAQYDITIMSPFLLYAAAHWPLHYVSQDATDADHSRKDVRMLCNIAGHQAAIWVPSYLKQRNLKWKGWIKAETTARR
jgi:hypothetical protein